MAVVLAGAVTRRRIRLPWASKPGLTDYFKHAVCKHTMSSLENFAWHRVIR